MNSGLHQLEIKDGHIFLDRMMLKGITKFKLVHRGWESNPELTLKMDVRTLPKSKMLMPDKELRGASCENRSNLHNISIQRIDSRSFLKVDESVIEIKDYKIVGSGKGDTEITVVINKDTALFETTCSSDGE